MEDISKVLETGNSEAKIRALEALDNTDDPEILKQMISNLDDEDLQVRGEAFSSLLLNRNNISQFLINSLDTANKNIRGFASLVLANRGEAAAIPQIIKLAKDEYSMVRSCALGALGHLRAAEAREVFLEAVRDSDMEVRKSALQGMIDLGITVSEERISEIVERDAELEKMILSVKE